MLLRRNASAPPAAALPPPPTPWRARVVKRALKLGALILVLLIAWLAFTTPLSRSLQPIAAPSITLLSAEGEPIARRGAIIEAPVHVADLPPYVGQAFISIEDRRFFHHIGIDPWGIARAMLRNLRLGRVREGGSTLTQQLARTSFLSPDRTFGRKAQEALITLWLEAWLTKEEILDRYLSNAYFGDNVYGLRAAAHHYFNTDPERLTLAQAAMLAGVVNAPSRLAPTGNLEGAQQRSRRVLRMMAEVGYISEAKARNTTLARVRRAPDGDVPTGTYFADWVLPQTGALEDEAYGERQIHTTLEGDMQRYAVRAIRRANLGGAQAALVAMRLDGRVVAMVGGRDYSQSAFNRATQARRQPGSAFKPFVYLAAFRAGMTPNTPVNDVPIRLGNWEPANYGNSYRGRELLRDAFAESSNSVAVQTQERVGRRNVIRAARDLGITSPLRADPSLALGTNGVSLIELTAAYAGIASGRYPIRAHGLTEPSPGWLGWGAEPLHRGHYFPMLRDVMYAVTQRGTGRAARLSIPTFGKTGTTSDYRDAWFVGFAGDLVVGIWVGNDDNTPLPGTTGGGLPARIWRAFMVDALGIRPARAPAVPLSQTDRTSSAPANVQAPPPEPQAPAPQVPDNAAPIPVGPAPQPGGATQRPPTN
ncbi:transglycosylase domain-containing protein [Sphingosinicella ginsenosidimutans]|uniref:Penicillin-binding protein n=1 Tax=Allosphingosinicella ginsenosidimutans TaxID=1176539 RepID=A0A5C6TTZ2_9SPHN|nr:transglycosylase domain-containing protein [Sphingosinicella ginsenosidimutans]TXC63904.1 penicillin-binding protein [Sphingosinicella ginsenosidimutans]